MPTDGLTVRERISALLDPESFHEVGALAGRASYDEDGRLQVFAPSNFIFGTGRVDGRRVVVGGDDFTVRGGAADAAIGNKMGYSEKLALEMRLPIVRLIEGTGGGGSVKMLEMMGRTYVPANPGWDSVVAVMGKVPVVAACLGPVAGLGGRSGGDIALFRDGARPEPVVRCGAAGGGARSRRARHERGILGGSHIHTRMSGAVDNEVADGGGGFRGIRRFRLTCRRASTSYRIVPNLATTHRGAKKS